MNDYLFYCVCFVDRMLRIEREKKRGIIGVIIMQIRVILKIAIFFFEESTIEMENTYLFQQLKYTEIINKSRIQTVYLFIFFVFTRKTKTSTPIKNITFSVL